MKISQPARTVTTPKTSKTAELAKVEVQVRPNLTIEDRFDRVRQGADLFRPVTGRLDEAGFKDRFGGDGMVTGRNAAASADPFTKVTVAIGGMVGGQGLVAAAVAGGATTGGFGLAFLGGALIGLGVNEASEAIAGDSLGGILGEIYGDAEFEATPDATPPKDTDTAGEPNPESETSSGTSLNRATGGRMGGVPEHKKNNTAVDPGHDDGTAAPGTGGMVTTGQCERLESDIAVIDGRSLARIKLLANGGIRA